MKALLILVLAFVLMSKMLFRSNLIKLDIFTINLLQNLKLSTAFSFIHHSITCFISEKDRKP